MADMTWRERLDHTLKQRGMSHRALSLAVGRASGYVYGLLREGKEPGVDSMVLICKVLEVSLSWLLFGVEMSDDTEKLLRLYSSLNARQQADFLRLAESAAGLSSQNGQ